MENILFSLHIEITSSLQNIIRKTLLTYKKSNKHVNVVKYMIETYKKTIKKNY